ncbi:heat shock protein 67B2 [Eurytemora carolleeae]|uniref:heat shock protein 67B2 n=1 Tax=Eurytemora carolleeae TaxID=1294199 RepID=UPI000C780DA4|nr:heat shock protein 67B2 [Eurytemora carolleeae]|eukprot:XP_023332107.1 heat shock protein 67B2-like [Eurytemora affinis]
MNSKGSRLLGQWTAIFRLNTWGIQGFSSFHLQPSYFPKALVLKPLRSCVWRNEHVMGVSSGIHLPNTVDFNDVKKHIANGTALIVDVRNQTELVEDGVLQGAVHIPLKEVEVAFALNSDSFLEKYKVPMPKCEDPIIFSCLAGIRASKAETAVNLLGFSNTAVYTGSFADWREQNK